MPTILERLGNPFYAASSAGAFMLTGLMAIYWGDPIAAILYLGGHHIALAGLWILGNA